MNMHGSSRYLMTLCLASAAAFSAYKAMAQDNGSNIAVVASAQNAAEAAYLTENDAAMTKMMDGMSIKPSGDVDRDFVAMMTPHHQGAIDMAIAALKYGKNEQLRRIAQEIIVEQQQEIIAMKLAIGDPLPPPTSAPTQAAPSGTMQGMAPGMKM
ncbi:protein of unknown function [Rhizobium lusitanum]|jgi:uncharacterized protein (DUF305 family)|uniref:DUF305 domain-containing protein n=2 Tax=Rhizobium lusitanum TaxID=293958 RepID=A0A1C3W0S9_9HYPH|nr:protein of unknown function [Rhizobium lusitanum]